MDPATLKPLFDLLAGLGAMGTPVAGIFAWLYFLERGERKSLSDKVMQMSADQMKAEIEMTTALQLLAAKVVK
jgi:hypothetical protein